MALVAEKIETQDEFRQARAEGFTLIQGYYFCRPVLLENRNVPANRLSHIEILRLLHEDSLDLRALTRLVKRDASLTYRLLRLINSPLCAVRQEVNSVQSALIAVGEDAFRRIATLAITSEINAGQPAEILRMAFVRGRFCELAARFCGLNSTEQYLLGLLSLVPAMLRLPMEELVPTLPLRDRDSPGADGGGPARSAACLPGWSGTRTRIGRTAMRLHRLMIWTAKTCTTATRKLWSGQNPLLILHRGQPTFQAR